MAESIHVHIQLFIFVAHMILYTGTVICEARLVDVLDKKSGAVVLVNGKSEWVRVS